MSKLSHIYIFKYPYFQVSKFLKCLPTSKASRFQILQLSGFRSSKFSDLAVSTTLRKKLTFVLRKIEDALKISKNTGEYKLIIKYVYSVPSSNYIYLPKLFY